MRFKTVVSATLITFVLLAVVFVVRDTVTNRKAVPAVAPAAMVSQGPSTAPATQSVTLAVVAPSVPQASREAATEQGPATRIAKSAANAAPEVVPATKQRTVVATYFHGNIRCATCRKVEAYAREAVEEGFGPQIASGSVAFRAVNVDDAANRHFIDDYQLTNKSVVVTEEVDGHVERWVKLDDVWSLVGDRPAYLTYVQDGVRGYLETR